MEIQTFMNCLGMEKVVTAIPRAIPRALAKFYPRVEQVVDCSLSLDCTQGDK